MRNTLLLCLSLLIACGGSATETETAATEATAGAEADVIDRVAELDTEDLSADVPSVVEIAGFSLLDDSERGLSMDPNGQMFAQAPGQGPAAGPVLHPDGRITRNGELIAAIRADGTLLLASGEMLAQIAEDGSTTVQGRSISWGEDGVLQGGNEGDPTIRLTPADTPAKRAATATLLLVLLSPEDSTSNATE